MSSDAMKRDVWPRILREVTYAIFFPFPKIESKHVDQTFRGIINRPDNSTDRNDYLIAIRAALASDVDLTAELGFPHSNEAVREFLRAVERRLSVELGA
jgi:hypothetical protein